MSADPIRLFVGVSPNGEDAESCAVLEHSVRSRSSLPVQIEWMHQSKAGFWSGWNTKSWRTPFSGFRWGIPAFCEFRGNAIYCDSDFIFVADLAELWTQENPRGILARSAGRKGKTCCLLLDCAKMQSLMPSIELIRSLPDVNGWVKADLPADLTGAFSGDWNCIDGGGYPSISDPRIKAIHYSRMCHQPHLSLANDRLSAEGRTHWYTGETVAHPRADLTALFMAELGAALSAGYTLDRYYFEATEIQKKNFTYDQLTK